LPELKFLLIKNQALLVSEADITQEVKNAEGSQAFSGKLRIRRTRVPEVPSEHSASMDKECSEVTQADRAGDR